MKLGRPCYKKSAAGNRRTANFYQNGSLINEACNFDAAGRVREHISPRAMKDRQMSTPPTPKASLPGTWYQRRAGIIKSGGDALAGYFRDGSCATDGEPDAAYLVYVRVTAEFLAFSVKRGNNLVGPIPQLRFRGLKPGERWRPCILRSVEA